MVGFTKCGDALCLEVAEQHLSLFENRRLLGIDVFGRLFTLRLLSGINDPAGESDDVARLVADREHKSADKGVVVVAVCIADFDKSGIYEIVDILVLGFDMTQERIATGRVPDAPYLDSFFVPAAGCIFLCRFRLPVHRPEKFKGDVVGMKQLVALESFGQFFGGRFFFLPSYVILLA